MTSRDSYRQPVSSHEAIEELRSVAGAQLDGTVVETFVGLLESAVPSRSATRTMPTSNAS